MRRGRFAALPLFLLACHQAPWVDLASPEHGFRARFPEAPVQRAGSAYQEEEWVAKHLGWDFRLDVQTIPDGKLVDRTALIAQRDAEVSRRLDAQVLATLDLEVPNGVGIEFTTNEPHSVMRVTRLFREDDRLFEAEVTGHRNVREAADTRTFFEGLVVEGRPGHYSPKPAPAVRISDAAVRAAALSYIALLKSGRYDEAWRYLPAESRAHILAGDHAAWCSRHVKPEDLDDATVIAVAAMGTNAVVTVGTRTRDVVLHASDRGGSTTIIPAPLDPR